MDDEIRGEFTRRSLAGGPAEELRERVRAALDAPPPIQRRRSGARLLVAASVLLLAGGLPVALAWLGATDGGDTASETRSTEPTRPLTSSVPQSGSVDGTAPVVSVSPQVPTASVNGTPLGGVRRVSSSQLRIPLFFDIPAAADRFVVIAETSRVLEISLAGPSDRSPPNVPILRIIVPDSAVSAVEVESALSGPHPDTLVTDVEDSTLGRYDTRVIRMESDKGTSAVGFSVTDQVSIGADGIDRSYEVHVIQTAREPIVVWIDATRAEFADARVDAAAILDSLRLVE